MKQNVCSYADIREEKIVEYLYDDAASEARLSFERHLTACALCRSEVDALRGVRAELGQWASPEPDFAVTVGESHMGLAEVRAANTVVTRQLPYWAQTIAAALLLGVGAGVANLDVHYSPDQGLSVRTGWRHAVEAAPQAGVASDATPWKNELVALEERLRTEMASHAVSTPVATPAPDDTALRRLRAMLDDSEQRQKREVALRLAEMAREVEYQRLSDLARIDRNLGLIQSRTGMEVMRTQQQVNSLAQRVSQRP